MTTSKAFCPWCRRGGITLTKRGRLWRHQPYGREFSGELGVPCQGSGKMPKSFYDRPRSATKESN